MVAVVAGSGLGLERTSQRLAGQAGGIGSATSGNAGEAITVNAETGNLVLSDLDSILDGVGLNATVNRTYNSLGSLSGTNTNHGWQNTGAQVINLTGTVGTAGSKVQRVGWDGSIITYSWNATFANADGTTGAYVVKEDTGALDSLTFNASNSSWTWHNGPNGVTETYAQLVSGGPYQVTTSTDRNGNAVAYSYSAGLITQITLANGEYTVLGYTGSNLTSLTDYLHGGVVVATTSYTYDTLNRLSKVTVDLGPGKANYFSGGVTGSVAAGGSVLTVSGVGYGTLAVGQELFNGASDTGLSIKAQLSGVNGGNGTYQLSGSSVAGFSSGSLSTGEVGGGSYTTTYTYQGTTNLVASVTQADGSQVSLTYDASNRVATWTQTVASGVTQTTTLTYATGSTQIKDALGNITTYTYNTDGTLKQIAAPAAVSGGNPQITAFTYDTNGDLLTLRVFDGTTNQTAGTAISGTTYTYDARGNMLEQADLAGNKVDYLYNLANEVTARTQYGSIAGGASQTAETTYYTYDTKGNQRFAISAQGRVTEKRYNAQGQVVSELSYPGDTYPTAGLSLTNLPSEAALESWAAGLTDLANTQRTDTVYDFRGNIASVTSYSQCDTGGNGIWGPANTQYTYVYDYAGRLLSKTGINASASEIYIYDGLGRVVASTSLNGGTASIQYNDPSDQVTTTYSNGLSEVKTFNKLGELASLTQSASGIATGTTSYAYDVLGRLVSTTNPYGGVTRYIYDNEGRRVASLDPAGALVQDRYDAAGRLIGETRYATLLTSAQISALTLSTLASTVTAIKGANDRTSWNIYNNAGQLLETIDARGAVNTYTYDGSGHETSRTSYATLLTSTQLSTFLTTPPTAVVVPTSVPAADRVTRKYYDGDGLLVASLDPDSFLTQYNYDAAGREISTIRRATAATSITASSTLAQILTSVGSSAKDEYSFTLYDDRGLVAATIGAEGDVTFYGYSTRSPNLVAQITRGSKVTPSTSYTLAALPHNDQGLNEVTTYTYNDAGQVLTEQKFNADPGLYNLVGGEVTTSVYDTMGHLLTSTQSDAGGGKGVQASPRTTTNRYDALGRIVQSLSGLGSAALAALGPNPTAAQISQVYASYGTSYTYDAAGLLTSKTVPVGGTQGAGTTRTLYYYDQNGRLRYTIDGLGEVTEQRYNAFGETTDQVRYGTALAPATIASWTGGVLTSAVTTAMTALASATLDSKTHTDFGVTGLVADTIDALGNQTTNAYNAFGELTSAQLPVASGVTSTQTLAYNGRGQVIQKTLDSTALALVWAYQRDGFGNVTRAASPAGNATTTSYDRLNRVLTSADGLGNATTLAYDTFGNVVSSTDALGNVTRWSFDAFARVATMTTPGGLSFTTWKDAYGQVVALSDGDAGGSGRVTRYTYDADGNLLTTTNADGTTSNVYDAADRLVDVVNANGPDTHITYDAVGRVLTRTVDYGTGTNPATGKAYLNLATTYSYDAKGQTIAMTDPTGVVTTYSYDLDGRRVSVVQDAGTGRLNVTTNFAYRADGKLISQTDAAGTSAQRVTTYAYDNLGRMISQTQDAGTGTNAYTGQAYLNLTTTYGYDADGNRTAETDPLGRTTYYLYDANDRQVLSVDAAGIATQTTYDADGRVIATRTYAMMLTAAQLTALAPIGKAGTSAALVPVAGTTNQFNINVTSAGKVTTAATLNAVNVGANADRLTQSLYDSDGHLAFSIDAAGYITQYTYDNSGNLLTERLCATPVTFTDTNDPGTIAFLLYDAVYLTDPAQGDYNSLSSNIYWNNRAWGIQNDADNLYNSAKFQSYGVATMTNAQYVDFLFKQVSGQSGTAAAEAVYVNQLAAGTMTRSQALLALALSPQHIAQINANRTQAARMAMALWSPNTLTSHTYDGANRLMSTTTPPPSSAGGDGFTTAYTYDALGETTGTTVAWGTGDAVTTTQTFDAGGRLLSVTRASGSSAAATTSYTYDGAGRVLTIKDPRGNITTNSYDALGRLLSVSVPVDGNVQNNSITRYTYDARGNRTSVTDPNGKVSYTFYDNLDRQVLIVNPNGFATQTAYLLGNTVSSVTQRMTAITGTITLGGASPTTLAQAIALITTGTGDLVTSLSYDADYRLIGTTDAAGGATTYQLDAFGNRVQTTNQLGGVTTATYDRRGLLLSTTTNALLTAANGTAATNAVTTAYAYDQFGNRIQMIEAQGLASQRVTTYGYDNDRRMISKQVGDLPAATFLYDSRGNLVRTVDPTGARSFTWYDAQDRKIADLSPTGTLSYYSYDANGNLVATRTFGTLLAWQGAPDGSGAVVAGGAPPGLNHIDNSTFIQGTQGWSVGPDNTVSVNAGYPATNWPNFINSVFNASAAGQIASLTTGNRIAVAAGDTLSVQIGVGITNQDPLGNVIGNQALVVQFFNASGQAVGAPQTLASINGAQPFNTRIGSFVTVPAGAVSMSLTLSVKMLGAGFASIQIDQPMVASVPANFGLAPAFCAVTSKAIDAANYRELDYTYDAANRLTSSAVQNVRTGSWNGSSYTTSLNALLTTATRTYDAAGHVVLETDGNGNKTYHYFDAAGLEVASVDPAGFLTTWTRDANGNVLGQTRYATVLAAGSWSTASTLASLKATVTVSATNDRTTTTTYDKAGRVLTETTNSVVASTVGTGDTITSATANSTLTYTYDAMGNRLTTRQATGDVTTDVYDNLGRHTKSYGPAYQDHTGTSVNSGTIYGYDALGNVTWTYQGNVTAAQVTPPAAPAPINTGGIAYTQANPNGIVSGAPVVVNDTNGLIQAQTNFTASSAGQTISIAQIYKNLKSFAAGSQLALSLGIGGTGPLAQQNIQILFLDANGNLIERSVPQIAPGTQSFNTRYFAQVGIPATAVSVEIEVQGTTSGAGNGSVSLIDPQLAIVPANLTSAGATLTDTAKIATGGLVAGTDSNGRASNQVTFNATAIGQQVSIASSYTSLTFVAGDKLAVSFTLTPGGIPAGTSASLVFYNAAGTLLTQTALPLQTSAAGYLSGNAQIAIPTGAAKAQVVVTATSWSVGQSSLTLGGLEVGVAQAANAFVLPSPSSGTVRITSYSYDADGRLASITNANGFSHTYGYDADGRQTSDSYQRNDSQGNLLNEAKLTSYDLAGRVIATRTSSPNLANYVSASSGEIYDAYGELVAQTTNAPFQNGAIEQQYVYDNAGRLVASNSSSGVWQVFVNDAAGNQTLAISSNGVTDLTPAVDASGLAVQANAQAIQASALALATNNGANTVGAAAGNGVLSTIFGFSSKNQANFTEQAQRTTDSTGTLRNLIQLRTYDAFGDVLSQTDAKGYVTNFTYNTLGNLVSQISPQVSVVGQNGAAATASPTTTNYYDIAGRLVGVRDADGNLTTRSLLAGTGYNGQKALVTAQFNPDGGVARTVYDALGNDRIDTDAMSRVTTNSYDAVGNLVEVDHAKRADGTQLINYYAYDQLGERIASWYSAVSTGTLTPPVNALATGAAASTVTATTTQAVATASYSGTGGVVSFTPSMTQSTINGVLTDQVSVTLALPSGFGFGTGAFRVLVNGVDSGQSVAKGATSIVVPVQAIADSSYSATAISATITLVEAQSDGSSPVIASGTVTKAAGSTVLTGSSASVGASVSAKHLTVTGLNAATTAVHLFVRPQGSTAPYSEVEAVKSASGSFFFDLSGPPFNGPPVSTTWSVQYQAMDASGAVYDARSGTVAFSATGAATLSLAAMAVGGPGQALLTADGNLVISGLPATTANATVFYRQKAIGGAWVRVQLNPAYGQTGLWSMAAPPTALGPIEYWVVASTSANVALGKSYGTLTSGSDPAGLVQYRDGTQSGIETTDYDGVGRVISSLDYLGHQTQISYTWNGAGTAGTVSALGSFGSWTQVTNNLAARRSSTTLTDDFGHQLSSQDLGSNSYSYTYDKLGELLTQTSSTGQNLAYSYFTNGQMASTLDGAVHVAYGVSYAKALTSYGYDANSNRVSESIVWSSGGPSGSSVTLENETVTYDALNRVTGISDPGDAANARPSFSQTKSYDAAGNLRENKTVHQNIGSNQQLLATSTTDDLWYAYDSLNRMVVSGGTLSGTAGGTSTTVVRGASSTDANGVLHAGGTSITYDLDGERATATTSVVGQTGTATYNLDTQESYSYSTDGYVANVYTASDAYNATTGTVGALSTPQLEVLDNRDALGRVTQTSQYNTAGKVVYSVTTSYNALGQTVYNAISSLQGTGSSQVQTTSATNYYYTDANGLYLNGAVASQSGTIAQTKSGKTTNSSLSLTNTYAWTTQANQSQIVQTISGGGAPGTTTSTFSYDVNGALVSDTTTGMNAHTISYVNNAQGEILSRRELVGSSSTAPAEFMFYLNGQQIGQIGNNNQNQFNYAAQIAQESAASKDNPGPFRNGETAGVSASNFDENFVQLNSNTDSSNATQITVGAGQTLNSIAQSLWGDGSLWYVIAEANGISSPSGVVAGQVLTVPNTVQNVHNNASTFSVYDPNFARGDVQPGNPPPPSQGVCGILGAILLAVVAVAVTVVTAGAAAAVLAPAATGGTVAGGIAAVGAGQLGFGTLATALTIGRGVGTFASQGLGILTGQRDGFDWGAIGLAAFSGALDAGLGPSGLFNSTGGLFGGLGKGLGMVARQLVTAGATEGLAYASGLHNKYDWVGVAAAGLSEELGSIPGLNRFSQSLGAVGGRVFAASVSGLATSGLQSLATGHDFVDTLQGNLPAILGGALSGFAADKISTAASSPRIAIDSSVFDGTIAAAFDRQGNPLDTSLTLATSASPRIAIDPSVFDGTGDGVTGVGLTSTPATGSPGGSVLGLFGMQALGSIPFDMAQASAAGANSTLGGPPEVVGPVRNVNEPQTSQEAFREAEEWRAAHKNSPDLYSQEAADYNAGIFDAKGRKLLDSETAAQAANEIVVTAKLPTAVAEPDPYMFNDEYGTFAADGSPTGNPISGLFAKGMADSGMESSSAFMRFVHHPIDSMTSAARGVKNAFVSTTLDAIDYASTRWDNPGRLVDDLEFGIQSVDEAVRSTYNRGFVANSESVAYGAGRLTTQAFVVGATTLATGGTGDVAVATETAAIGEGGAAGRQVLYHYTNEAGVAGITESNSLNPSLWKVGTKDVRYGNGQYVSDIVPGTRTPAELSRDFLGQPFQGSRFTHYVEIDATGLGAVQGRAGVYVIPNEAPLDLTGRLLSSGKVPVK